MAPLPGRDCAGCTACCIVPAVEAADFNKPPSVTCAHCNGAGCAIYETRPQACRDFECGWRVLSIIPESLKPDHSGVLVAPESHAESAIKFIFMTDDALNDAALLECIAGLVHARAPVFVAAPGPRAHHALKALLNPRIELAVERRDAVAIAHTLASIVAALRRGPFEPA